MKQADVIELNSDQAIRLPDEFRFDTDRVLIRRDGNSVILEPSIADEWPEGFFDSVHITDPASSVRLRATCLRHRPFDVCCGLKCSIFSIPIPASLRCETRNRSLTN